MDLPSSTSTTPLTRFDIQLPIKFIDSEAMQGSGGSRPANYAREDSDAKCIICNSGDYEDEDKIVFCESCNVPVH